MTSRAFRTKATANGLSAQAKKAKSDNCKYKVWIPMLCLLWITLSLEPLLARGNKEFPVIELNTSGKQHLSPNGDGIQDTGLLKFKVTVHVKSKQGYVPSYGLKIIDAAGKTVKEVKETDKRDVRGFAVLFRRYEKFSLEREVGWDGKADDGQLVSDGLYTVTVWVKDSSRNVSELKVEDFVVDTIIPTAQIAPQGGTIFSPNGDGFLDTFNVSQTSGTTEARWVGKIINQESKTVREYTWENSPPLDFSWDGKDHEGQPLPDGRYAYTLNSTDLAGNKSADYSLKEITVKASATPVQIISKVSAFSPNGDNLQDILDIQLDYNYKEDITGWNWSVKDEAGKKYAEDSHTLSGKKEPPNQVIFTGLDADGKPLPEGKYTFTCELVYEQGNRPVIKEVFILDITPPQVILAISERSFTPNGDGMKDTTTISFTADEPVSWQGKVKESTGGTVLEAAAQTALIPFLWNGKDGRSLPVKDGRYFFEGLFTDQAGNQKKTDDLAIALSTQQYPVAVKAPKVFSPNSDGKSDKLVLKLEAANEQAVEKWSIQLEDESGEIVRNIEGENGIPKDYTWDGMVNTRQGEKAKAKEGVYTAVLNTEYNNGSTSISEKTRFLLDVTPPKVKLGVTADPFTQTDKGLEGQAFITLQVEDSSDVQGWSLDILNKQKEIVRSFTGEGDPSEQIAWNGEGETGQITKAQEIFTLRVNVVDAGGNASTFTQDMPLDVLVVRKNGKLYLMVPNVIFGAYKSDLDSAGKTQLARNQDALARVAQIYQKYPHNKLLLEGHALDVYLGNKIKEKKEEGILLPLTDKRAGTVRDALVKIGLPQDKIETKGFGGYYPLVSVKDKKVYWKNRRVEFIMLPQPVEKEKPATE
jgi:flagellar hook assembly protein FlgD